MEGNTGSPSTGSESVAYVGKQGTQDAVTAVFVQGQIFERVTLIGTREIQELTPYAWKAEQKAN